MTEEFSFGDSTVANSYDEYLVPLLFSPWAHSLVAEHQPWAGKRVLDLATGTGIVAQLLAQQIGAEGSVVAHDLNAEMLTRARLRCKKVSYPIEFVEGSAESLAFPSESFDVVVCQQGFQFFSDKDDAASEIHRVLCNQGRTIITTWRPVAECHFIGAICDALDSVGETQISKTMRIPFDLFSETDLAKHFASAGFKNVEVVRRQSDLVMQAGPEGALRAAYSTPIGPMLKSLPAATQNSFKQALAARVSALCTDGITIGQMASNVLTADK